MAKEEQLPTRVATENPDALLVSSSDDEEEEEEESMFRRQQQFYHPAPVSWCPVGYLAGLSVSLGFVGGFLVAKYVPW